ncbi:MAG TPA: DUF1801 domain-containing protein [Aggregatilineales bacterium]|nr:DUF1801 domain-containing protein [Aggregatilineales bacterium]
MTLTVDDYVKTNILPQHQDIVKAIRDLMRECAPNAKEYIAYGIPVWKVNKIFAVISPNKKAITFSFTHGAEFEDKYGLLKGVGKVSRHVKIKDVRDIPVNEAALRYYIQQALEFDAK